jgi:serpin B
VLPAFAEVIARHYGATLNAVDFCRDPDGACRTINQWVSAATRQRISDLLDASLLTIDTRLVLVNAVYFKGVWQHSFEPEDTHDAPFYLENGGSVKARMMSRVTHVGYRKGPGYQAVTLPYLGAAISMLVLLPDRRDGLRDLERSLTVPMLGELMRLRPVRGVELFLPRFTITWGGDLVRALGTLGIQRAFTREEADFSGINGRQPPDEDALYVSHVLHKAFSAVNEEGTEAAVATAVEFSLCAGIDPQPPPPVFRADHPFLFAIGDGRSGTVLFLGRVVDPTQAA